MVGVYPPEKRKALAGEGRMLTRTFEHKGLRARHVNKEAEKFGASHSGEEGEDNLRLFKKGEVPERGALAFRADAPQTHPHPTKGSPISGVH